MDNLVVSEGFLAVSLIVKTKAYKSCVSTKINELDVALINFFRHLSVETREVHNNLPRLASPTPGTTRSIPK